MKLIGIKTVKARKNHRCDGWDRYVQEEIEEQDSYRCKGIQKGTLYEKRTIVEDADIWDFRVCLECKKYAKENKIALYD